MKIIAIILILLLLALGAFCTQITIFVIQPIGAVPEGRTLVMLRGEKTKFIESADSLCQREMGGVSLMCRLMTLGAVVDKNKILINLPYSEILYNISTGGNTYTR